MRWLGDRSRHSAIAMATTAMALTVAIVSFPDVAFEASIRGLELWFEIVLPALFPFFTMSEVLMGLGVIHWVGTLLEPVMRPLFRIPGTGAFAVAMGLASGYPLGAKITGRLRRQQLCDPIEAERLVSLANTADPLFISGAVAIGMFGQPAVGAPLLVAHYAAVFVVGWLMRYHAGGRQSTPERAYTGALLPRAFREMHRAREADGRPFGQLIADAVRDSFQSMLFVGGVIMMFSVIIRVLEASGIVGLIATSLGLLLQPLGIHPGVIPALVNGTVEITLGTQSAASAQAPMLHKMMAASAIIAWSGLSVHAQVAALLHGTGVRLAPYVWARLLHAVTAAAFTGLLYLAPLSGWTPSLAVAVTTPSQAAPSPLALLAASTAGAFLVPLVCLAAAGLVLTSRGLRLTGFVVRRSRPG